MWKCLKLNPTLSHPVELRADELVSKPRTWRCASGGGASAPTHVRLGGTQTPAFKVAFRHAPLPSLPTSTTLLSASKQVPRCAYGSSSAHGGQLSPKNQSADPAATESSTSQTGRSHQGQLDRHSVHWLGGAAV
jgi:hypothetical protein